MSIFRVFPCLLYWIIGHLLGYLFYDKKYLRGRWFSGKLFGLCAPGWKWVTAGVFSRMLGFGHRSRYPVSSKIKISQPGNINFSVDDLNNFQGQGNYYQALGKISIGKGTYIGPNVGLITANHDPDNLDRNLPAKNITIGENCWIGMNAMVLPGVILGNHTIVGAGSVVTKSFEKGNCIIAGNPAKVIKEL